MTERVLLDEILRPGRLSTAFQPIYEIRASPYPVHALECLTRGPAGTNVASAGILFEYARRKGKECALDRQSLMTAFRAAAGIPGSPRLSVNVHASTFERDPGFPEFLEETAEERGIAVSRLVLEIVEHAPAFAGPRLLRAIDALRAKGVGLALDDIGLGQSNYRMMIECHPDYFKVDSFLVQGCSFDAERQAVLDSLAQLARRFGSRIVAEGIETRADLFAVRLLGFDFAQGYLLSKPRAADTFGAELAAHPEP